MQKEAAGKEEPVSADTLFEGDDLQASFFDEAQEVVGDASPFAYYPEAEKKKRCALLLVGNPGTGKSTILSTLVGKAGVFHSGTSAGSGLTYELQETDHEFASGRVTLMDTPGLDDVMNREAAAEQIKTAFEKDGLYKLVFVVKLTSGRVRTSDALTMKIVLEAIGIEDLPYGIIINQITENAYNKCLVPLDARKRIFAGLNKGHSPTRYVFAQHKIKAAHEQEDKLLQQSAAMVEWLQRLPAQDISAGQVKDLEYDQLAKLQEKFDADLDKIKNNQAAAEKELNAQLTALKNRPPRPVYVHHHGCFSPKGVVVLEDGSRKCVEQLRAGDRVESVDARGRRVFSDVYWNDMVLTGCKMYAVECMRGDGERFRTLLTEDHLMIVVKGEGSSKAKQVTRPVQHVRAGQRVLVSARESDDAKMEQAVALSVQLVDEISGELRRERYEGRGCSALSPAEQHWVNNCLTLNNKMVVDGVLASSFAGSYAFQSFDTLDMKLAYKVAPKVLKSQRYQKLIRKWDAYTEAKLSEKLKRSAGKE